MWVATYSEVGSKFKAVHGWHVDIAHDQVDASLLHAGRGFHAIARLEYFFDVQTSLAEGPINNLPHHGGIVPTESIPVAPFITYPSHSRKGFLGIPPPNSPEAPNSMS